MTTLAIEPSPVPTTRGPDLTLTGPAGYRYTIRQDATKTAFATVYLDSSGKATFAAPRKAAGPHYVTARDDAGAETRADYTVGTPPPPPPPPPPTDVIGGDPSKRGPKPFTLSPTSRRFSGANGNLTMSTDGEVWEFEPGATAGSITIAANGCTIRGGRITGGLRAWRSSSKGHDLTVEDMVLDGGGSGILAEAKHGWTVRRVQFTNQTNEFVRLYCDQPSDPDVADWLFEDCIAVRNAGVAPPGSGISTFIGRGAGSAGPGRVRRVTFRNCYIDGGAYNVGWFGIEFFYAVDTVVDSCDLRGGHDLMSIVRSPGTLVRYTLGHLDVAGTFFEHAGQLTTGVVFDHVEVRADGPRKGYAIYQNNGATGLEIHDSRFVNIASVVNFGGGSSSEGGTGGGAYIHDSCRADTGTSWTSGQTPTSPNRLENLTEGCL